jgi:hypothetical protein
MSSLVISGDTSGAVTVAAPAVAGSTTLTLQAVTGTMALQSEVIGVSQTWTDVTGSRTTGTTYTNSTGKPIFIAISGGSAAVVYTINGITGFTSSATSYMQISFMVPNGNTYAVTNNFVKWAELR